VVRKNSRYEVIEQLDRAEKGTIALIDDNEDNRFIFRTWLEEQYNVVEFSEGQDAIIGMKECKPDWVFLDISLPGIDGIEVLRRIRSDNDLRQIPVFALTAHAMIGDRERFLALGFDAYVGKPILDLRTLTNVIENAARKAAAG